MASQWFISRVGAKSFGPFTSQKLKELASTGGVLASDMIRKEGADKTVKAGKLKALFPRTSL
jgi:hypothetical protein